MEHRQHDDSGHAVRLKLWVMGRSGRIRGSRLGRFMRRRHFDGPRFGAKRRLTPQELQLVLLAMLVERPSLGHELLTALEERSGGFYSPSPTLIQASLAYLEQLGHALAAFESGGKRYSISAGGHRFLDQDRTAANAILIELEKIGERMGSIRRTFADEVLDEEEPVESEECRQARRALKQALTSKRHANQEQVRIINAILERAAGEILRVGGED